MENSYRQAFKEKQGYAGGQTTDFPYKCKIYEMIKDGKKPAGYTPGQIVERVRKMAGMDISPRTAGILLNDITVMINDGGKYVMTCQRTARAGKTKSWIYIIDHRKNLPPGTMKENPRAKRGSNTISNDKTLIL